MAQSRSKRWSADTAAEVELYVAEQRRRLLRQALRVTVLFTGTILALVPFLAGHSLHKGWDAIGKKLLLFAMGEWLWLIWRWGLFYNSWQTARETRRDMANKD